LRSILIVEAPFACCMSMITPAPCAIGWVVGRGGDEPARAACFEQLAVVEVVVVGGGVTVAGGPDVRIAVQVPDPPWTSLNVPDIDFPSTESVPFASLVYPPAPVVCIVNEAPLRVVVTVYVAPPLARVPESELGDSVYTP